MGVKEIPFLPLCCISILTPCDPDSLPQHQDHPSLSLALPWARFESAAVESVLYKWTNYGKRWQWRWFCLKDSVLCYSKLRRSHCVSNLLIEEGDDFRDLIESMMDEEGVMKLVEDWEECDSDATKAMLLEEEFRGDDFNGLRLVHLLMADAEALTGAKKFHELIQVILVRLKELVSPTDGTNTWTTGTAMGSSQ